MGRKPKDKAVTLCSHSSNAKCPNCKPRAQRLSKTTWQQRLKIVEWLEDEKNFKLITGAAATGPVKAGAKLTKKCDLAHFVNEKCCSNWNIKNAKARYLAVYKSYKDAIRLHLTLLLLPLLLHLLKLKQYLKQIKRVDPLELKVH